MSGFFKQWGEFDFDAKFYECRSDFTVEDLYQAFKERMAHEAWLEKHDPKCCLRTGEWSECDCGYSPPTPLSKQPEVGYANDPAYLKEAEGRN